MAKTIHGKCPRCCPDGGAIFSRWGAEEKKCHNCHLVLPFRRIKPTGKPTPSQDRILAQVVQLFGGTPEIRMIGRTLWFSLVNRERNWLLGDSLFGTIEPKGKFKITLQRIGGDKVLTDQIGLKVYLEWKESVRS